METLSKLQREAELKNMVVSTLANEDDGGKDAYMHPASVVGHDRYRGRYWVAFVDDTVST